eukprot:TRINITY_DN71900_c0_g1_i1.p1 TRINITY_DN71900_c0_g1~~TRINITY_DN71900_c0_g1_i1.p1  ORF type:complete len:138 (+),score=31.51 TRINITY_DN71900_c0_g1_i1:55-468(+)
MSSGRGRGGGRSGGDRHTDTARHRAKAAEAASKAAPKAPSLPSNAYRYKEQEQHESREASGVDPSLGNLEDLSSACGAGHDSSAATGSATGLNRREADQAAAAAGINIWAVEELLRSVPLSDLIDVDTSFIESKTEK